MTPAPVWDGRWLLASSYVPTLGDRFSHTHNGETRPGYVWVDYVQPGVSDG